MPPPPPSPMKASYDQDAATGEGSTSNEGTATDEGTFIISQRRQERLRPASSGPETNRTSVIIKAHQLHRRRLHDTRLRD